MSNAQKYYNQHSRGYLAKWESLENPKTPSEFYRQFLKKRALETGRVKFGEKVIEIGCGTGLVLKELLKYTNFVFGADISAEMLKRARDSVLKDKTVKLAGSLNDLTDYRAGEVWLAVSDFSNIKLPADYFDKIFSVEVLRYIDNIGICFTRLKPAMKNNTIFVFTVTNFWSANSFPIKYTVRKLLGLIKPDELQQFFITDGSIRRILKTQGYAIVSFERLGFLTANPLSRKFIKNERMFNRLAGIDAVLAKFPLLNKLFDTFLISVKKSS